MSYDIYFSLSNLLHSVRHFLDLSMLLQMALFHYFSWPSNIPFCICTTGFPSGSVVTNVPAMPEPQQVQVQSLGLEDPLEEGMATLPCPGKGSILAGESHGQRGPGKLQTRGVQRVGHN